MNIEQLYRDFNVPHASEGHKHCRPGWVNTSCPFCTGNPGLHLGYNEDSDRFICWRCGGHFADASISKLLNVGKQEARAIMKLYGVRTRHAKEPTRKIKRVSFKLPANTGTLQSNHKKYLEGRKFDPDKLIELWNLKGTGPSAKLDKINYKHRIIIPFTWGGKVVSFDSRDITDKNPFKYMACSEEREEIGHKQILYGKEDAWGDTGICVEGPTDVWRMGVHSFAVSGIKYTGAQLRIMSKRFKRIFVIFDDDPQAVRQAKNLYFDLRFRGVECTIINIKGDPGSLPQTEADYLVKQLIK